MTLGPEIRDTWSSGDWGQMGQFTAADCNTAGLSVARSDFFLFQEKPEIWIFMWDCLILKYWLTFIFLNMQIRHGCCQDVAHSFSVGNLSL